MGTHKGVVARRIHTKSATEGTTLMRLQCRDLTEKNWDMLLNNAASPIHATGYRYIWKTWIRAEGSAATGGDLY